MEKNVEQVEKCVQSHQINSKFEGKLKLKNEILYDGRKDSSLHKNPMAFCRAHTIPIFSDTQNVTKRYHLCVNNAITYPSIQEEDRQNMTVREIDTMNLQMTLRTVL